MAAFGTPRTWIPYMNNRDCSMGFCSLYCPQWCSILYPPPPHFEFPNDSPSPTFSPLVIAIIGILASAFLLVSYYTIISKYCGNNSSARRDQNHGSHSDEFEDNQNASLREPWDAATIGLDEALIKSITVCKYKKGDGLIGVTDCSVCLNEFQENESLRLLPKCSHAFHLPCIDTWLKSHSNCPLCRANIVVISAPSPLPPPPPPPPPFAHENPQPQPALHENQHGDNNVNIPQQAEINHTSEDEVVQDETAPETPLRTFNDSIIEITDESGCHQHLRRSFSMDHQSCINQRRSIADVLSANHDHQIIEVEEEYFTDDIVGSQKDSAEESKSSSTRKLWKPSHDTMNRSLSGGRFFLSRG